MSREIEWTDKGPVIDILRKDGSVRCTKVLLKAACYDDGGVAIEAECTEGSRMLNSMGLKEGELGCPGEPWGTLTVNPDEKIGDGYLCVKDYSEGEGNLRTLVDYGIVEKTPVRSIRCGYVLAPVCRLTETGHKLIAAAVIAAEMEKGHE